MSDLTMKHNTEANRYEAWDGDALAGFAEYQLTDDLAELTPVPVPGVHPDEVPAEEQLDAAVAGLEALVRAFPRRDKTDG